MGVIVQHAINVLHASAARLHRLGEAVKEASTTNGYTFPVRLKSNKICMKEGQAVQLGV